MLCVLLILNFQEPPHSVVSAPLPPVPKKPPLASKTQYEELDIIHSNASKVTKVSECVSGLLFTILTLCVFIDSLTYNFQEPPHSVVSTPLPPVPKKPPHSSKTWDNTQTPSAMESGQSKYVNIQLNNMKQQIGAPRFATD